MPFCSLCGRESRGDDRFCVGCGAEINADASPGGAASQFRSPDHPQRRAGGFVVRHARGLLALGAVAVVVVLAALSTSSSDTQPSAHEVASSAATPSAEAQQDKSGSSTPAGANAEQETTATGADGQIYSCPRSSLARIDAAKDRIDRREQALKARRAAIRRLEKRYPSGKAPGAVVDRYNELVAREKSELRRVNRAVDQYNGLLRRACTPD